MVSGYDEKLADIVKQIKSHIKPQPVTARTFIEWFGAQRRSYWNVVFIRRALKKHRLITKPDFEFVYIDSLISFEIELKGTAAEGQLTRANDVDEDPTYRIGTLASANKRPASVKPDASLSEALTLMLSYDYSQLPVMTNDRDVKGIISWASIGSRLALDKRCEYVRDCMVRHQEIPADTYLFTAVDDIFKHGYVLIRNAEKVISGIVTTTDLSLLFRQLGEPFLIVGEIENYLRRMIQDKYTKNELKEACDSSDEARDIQDIADLTFGEFLRLLENPDRWDKLELSINREQFIKQLNEIRQIRNDVMHFNPDSIPEQDLEKLRCFARLMQNLAQIGVI